MQEESIRAPGLDSSALCHEKGQKKLSGVKLRNIANMYEAYITKDRLPRQLLRHFSTTSLMKMVMSTYQIIRNTTRRQSELGHY